jgi:hypothetical protein
MSRNVQAPQFEMPQSRRSSLIFVASLVLGLMFSPIFFELLDRCFVPEETAASETQSDGDIHWDIRSEFHFAPVNWMGN